MVVVQPAHQAGAPAEQPQQDELLAALLSVPFTGYYVTPYKERE